MSSQADSRVAYPGRTLVFLANCYTRNRVIQRSLCAASLACLLRVIRVDFDSFDQLTAPPIPGIKLRPGDRRSVPEAAVSERQVYRDHRDPTAWLGWHPFGAAICSDAIGAFPSGILGFGVSPRGFAPSRRAPHLMLLGYWGAEGPRGLGMDTPWATWTGPTPISLYNPCKKSV